MELEELKNGIKKINELIKKEITEEENNRRPIFDGAFDAEEYFNSPIKIAWLLKEPYEGENGEGGGWDYADFFKQPSDYEQIRKHGYRATYLPIAYVSYGILNNFVKWDVIESMRYNKEICEVIKQIALINVQKLPSKGRTKTNNKDLELSINKHGYILKEQIDLLNPDILICGNTIDLYTDLFDLKEEDAIISDEILKYYRKDNKIFIKAYHPAQRGSREKYVNDIICTAQNWYNKKK